VEILPPLSEEDRMLSGLCYPFWPVIPAMVLLGARRDEPFVHFHALQALALGLLSTGGSVVLVLGVWLTLKVLPGGSPTFSGVVGLGVFSAAFFGLAFYVSFVLYTAWRAGDGRFLRLPFVGAWAESRMQANLGLGPEDYSVDPLPAAAVAREGGSGQTVLQPFEPERLTRQHRPAQTPILPKRPRRLDFQEGQPSAAGGAGSSEQEPAPEATGELPGAEAVQEEGFQPGLFGASQAPGSRRFRWEPLDPEDQPPETTSDGEFRAW